MVSRALGRVASSGNTVQAASMDSGWCEAGKFGNSPVDARGCGGKIAALHLMGTGSSHRRDSTPVDAVTVEMTRMEAEDEGVRE